MKKTIKTILLLVLSLFLFQNCLNQKKTSQKTNFASVPGPKVIIYKTKSDYYNNIPVILSIDKKSIASFPDITDIYLDTAFAKPIKLNNGYLLDQRGINQNVAFLSYTYEEYSKLSETPSLVTLYSNIIDNDPLIVMYDCGSKLNYNNVKDELNNLINSQFPNTFKKLK